MGRVEAGTRASQRGIISLTMAIIVICVGVWLKQITTPGFTDHYALIPSQAASDPLRLFTSMWLHSLSPFHILANMLSLYVLGSQIESVLTPLRYLGLYLISGLAGNLAFWALGPDLPAVGASGAIFGLLGFALVWTRFNSQVVLMTAINVIIGFTVPNIAWQAHFGGMVAGMALAFLWFTLPELRKRKSLAS